MAYSIRPTGNRLIVKTIDSEIKSDAGIYLPTAYSSYRMGSVLAVGPGKKNSEGVIIPMDIAVGDTVCFWSHTGKEIDSDTFILEEEEVWGIEIK